MNEIQLFTNDLFGSIRAIKIGKEAWFVGRDVALCLGYQYPANAIQDHVFEEDKMGGQNTHPSLSVIDNLGRVQYPIWINISGVFSLVLSSKLPSARQFKHWVTSELLPLVMNIGIDRSEELLRNELNKLQEENKYLNNQLSIVGDISLHNNYEVLNSKIIQYNIINNPYLSTQDKINILTYDPTTYNPELDLEEEINKFKKTYNV